MDNEKNRVQNIKDIYIEDDDSLSITSSVSTKTTAGLPKRFGRYIILNTIAHGGMATLYLARLDGPVGFEKFLALKKIHPHLAEQHQFVKMFLDEARFAAQISHPNVVQIFELGEVEGEFFFAMEYLEGESLSSILKKLARMKMQPPLNLICYIIARASSGLHAAHELRDHEGKLIGLVHRDVSPQNIVVTYDGEVKVVDFGIAKAAGRLTHTATGELKGKFAYMSPEQIVGKTIDRRSDIFSLGIVLWEATLLKRLFKTDSELTTLDRITKGSIIPPREIKDYYPIELNNIVMKALEKDPEKRYQTANELAVELDSFVSMGEEVISPSKISEFMQTLFAEEIAIKRKMLEEARNMKPPEVREKKSILSLYIVIAIIASIIAISITFGFLYFFTGKNKENFGTARIESIPSKAYVIIDGKTLKNLTPINKIKLIPGEHLLTIRKDGFNDVNEKFIIKAQELVSLRLTLTPKEKPIEKGHLILNSEEKLVKILIDNNEITPEIPLKKELEPGRHELQVWNEKGDLVQRIFEIHSRETKELTVTFPKNIAKVQKTFPKIKKEGYGKITIFTIPWAIAKIGEKTLGQTPLSNVKVPSGKLKISLYPQGENPPKHVYINLEPNGEEKIKINLNN